MTTLVLLSMVEVPRKTRYGKRLEMPTATDTKKLNWTRLREYESNYSYLLTYRAEGVRYVYRICRWVSKSTDTEWAKKDTESTWTILVHEKDGVGSVSGMGGKGWKKLLSAKDHAQGIETWGH